MRQYDLFEGTEHASNAWDARLCVAVEHGWLHAVQRCLIHGANPNVHVSLIEDGSGVAHRWSFPGHFAEEGLTVHQEGRLLDLSAAEHVSQTVHQEVLIALLAAGADPRQTATNVLLKAIRRGQETLVQELLNAGVRAEHLNPWEALNHPWLARPMGTALPLPWLERSLALGMDPNHRFHHHHGGSSTTAPGVSLLAHIAARLDVVAVERLLRAGGDPFDVGNGQTLSDIVRNRPLLMSDAQHVRLHVDMLRLIASSEQERLRKVTVNVAPSPYPVRSRL